MKNLNLFLLLSLLLSSCGSSMYVRSELQDSIDLKGKTTYSIVAPENLHPNINPTNTFRIESAIRREFNAIQYKETQNNSDISISFFALVNTVRDVDTYVNYYGRRHWGMNYITTDIHEYKEGTLILDIIDNKSKQVVWHGTAMDTIDSMYQIDDKINKAIKLLVQKYVEDSQSEDPSLTLN